MPRLAAPDRLPVASVLSEGREEVLALLEGDADVAPLRLAGWALGALAGPPSRAGLRRHHKDIGGRCRVSWCPGHRTGRFADILSTSVVVAEVDVIELPVNHD